MQHSLVGKQVSIRTYYGLVNALVVDVATASTKSEDSGIFREGAKDTLEWFFLVSTNDGRLSVVSSSDVFGFAVPSEPSEPSEDAGVFGGESKAFNDETVQEAFAEVASIGQEPAADEPENG